MNIDWLSVLIGGIIACIIGLPIAWVANLLFDKYKEKRKRKAPYIFITNVSGGMFEFEGRVWESTAMGTTVKEIAKQVLGEVTKTPEIQEPTEESQESDTQKESDETN